MSLFRKISAVVLAVIISSICLPVQALAPLPERYAGKSFGWVTTGSAYATPVGFQIFCLKSPQHCRNAGNDRITMTPAIAQLIEAVNTSVNHSIRPKVRPTQVWEIGARVGDCKDYAMTKWDRLMQTGFPAGSLRFAIGYTARGEGHAVLIVRTTSGDLVLDNLTTEVLGINDITHHLIAISGSDPRKWASIA